MYEFGYPDIYRLFFDCFRSGLPVFFIVKILRYFLGIQGIYCFITFLSPSSGECPSFVRSSVINLYFYPFVLESRKYNVHLYTFKKAVGK